MDKKAPDNIKAALGRPEIVAALKRGFRAEMRHALPLAIKRKVRCLKNIQLEVTRLEGSFYEEVHALETKYHEKISPLFEKRSAIVNGLYQPRDEECIWTLDGDDESVDNAKTLETSKQEVGDNKDVFDANGVPDFWLTIFTNVDMISEIVQDYDIPVLKHLQDIKVVFHHSNPMGFTLEFYFSQNEYFTNSVLTKNYEMKCAPDPEDPFSFEGPEIFKCRGCIINWKLGMNLTLRTIHHQGDPRSGKISCTKVVTRDSFFNFFSPPIIPDEDCPVVTKDTLVVLIKDFEIGHFIKERIIPRAVLFFTGECLDEEEWEDEYEEEEEDEDEENEESVVVRQ